MSESVGSMEQAAVHSAVLVQGQPVAEYPELAPEADRGSLREITEVGAEVLHHPCHEVVDFGTQQLRDLIDDMFLTMYVAEGVGLAANQVGVDLRVFVFDCPDDEGVRHVGHIVNPVVHTPAEDRRLTVDTEGCLSVPGPHADLARAEAATVRGWDRDGAELELSGTGYFARCLQHETDHLNGKLYIDRLPRRQRSRVLKRMDQLREDVLARRAQRALELAQEPDSQSP
ncbi:peptide deformylase [Lipingzhangella sp. LS1_29]|uniref:Peptide deformylase n=1 Tax=Lipingzhangella rawalii TaxID=2055835 RepID=A0ABU2H8T0_9ACTN|nr:peptide deformylase [Lipingzhangella rawalii]MDS1271718.1 peptide deformylase [Lipingzhangella rawalii]